MPFWPFAPWTAHAILIFGAVTLPFLRRRIL
jgi:hypothetical protein